MRPARFCTAELAKVGVAVVTGRRAEKAPLYRLRCKRCGTTWVVREGRRMPAGYWRCPGPCRTGGTAARLNALLDQLPGAAAARLNAWPDQFPAPPGEPETTRPKPAAPEPTLFDDLPD